MATRWWVGGVLAVVAASGTAVGPTPSAGAAETVLTVSTTDDVVDAGDGVLSLREAVTTANAATGGPDDRVRIELPPDLVYELSICDGTRASEDDDNAGGDLDYTGALTLVVAGDLDDGYLTTPIVEQTCSAESGERVFDASAPLELRDLGVRNGDASGDGGAVRATTLVAENAHLSGNTAEGDGGAVSAEVLDARASEFRDNESGADGGAISAGSVHVDGSSITGMPGLSVANNVAAGDGGGIAASEQVELGGSAITSNRAGGHGGGIAAPAISSIAEAPPSTIAFNRAGGDGGGARAGSADLAGVSVEANAAASRGGGVAIDGTAELTDVRLDANVAIDSGGAIWSSGELDLRGAALRDNRSALGDGGAVWSSGSLDAVDVSMARNRASRGGAIAASGEVFLDRGVLAANTAPDGGGGAHLTGTGPTWIRNTEVVDNEGSVGGLVYSGVTGDHLLQFTSLVGNTTNLGVIGGLRIASTVLAEPEGSNCMVAAPLAGPDPLTAPIEAQGFQPSYATDSTCRLTAPGSTNSGTEPGFLASGDPLQPSARISAPTSPLRGAVHLPAGAVVTALDGRARPVGTGADIGAREESEALVHTVSAQRIYDSRKSPDGALGPAATRTIDLTGAANAVPDHNQGVLLNITVVAPSADTFVTVSHPGDTSFALPDIHAAAGTTTAAAHLLLPRSDGLIEVRNDAGTAHVLVDVVGYVADSEPPGEALTMVTPQRVADTRATLPLEPGETRSFDVDGGAVPAGAHGVVVNLTGVGATAPTHLTAWQAGTPRPPTSTLNLPAGRTMANQAVIPIDGEGRIAVRNSSGSVHLVVDVVGYLDEVSADPSANDAAVHPVRHELAYNSVFDVRGPLVGGATRTVRLGGFPGHARAAVVSISLTPTSGAAHLTAWAPGTPRPPTSNVNAPAGVTTSNQAIVPVNDDGEIDLRLNTGTAQVSIIVTGWVG